MIFASTRQKRKTVLPYQEKRTIQLSSSKTRSEILLEDDVWRLHVLRKLLATSGIEQKCDVAQKIPPTETDTAITRNVVLI